MNITGNQTVVNGRFALTITAIVTLLTGVAALTIAKVRATYTEAIKVKQMSTKPLSIKELKTCLDYLRTQIDKTEKILNHQKRTLATTLKLCPTYSKTSKDKKEISYTKGDLNEWKIKKDRVESLYNNSMIKQEALRKL
jgi:hypothetical protein